MKSLRIVFAIGDVTLKEIFRDKVLYNILVCALLLLAVSYLASKLTFMRADRIVLDFGVSALSISCAAIALFTGAGLLGREIERRTITIALAKPISTLEFVFGKFFGLFQILFINWILLVAGFMAIYLGSEGSIVDAGATRTLAIALFYAFIQSVLIAAISMFFSSFSTTALSAIITVGVYLVGQNISQIQLILKQARMGPLEGILNSGVLLIPNLELFNLGTKVAYGLPVTAGSFAMGVAYGALYSLALLFFAGLLLARREL